MPYATTRVRVQEALDRFRTKTRSLRAGGTCGVNRHQIGILPKKGWRKRNVQFIRHTILPHMFAPRSGLPGALPMFPEIGDEEATVTWIGHASFLIQIAGRSILVDPNWALWLSIFKRVRHPGIPLAHLPDIDLVLITHAHHDHLHIPTLRAIANRQPIIVPRGVGSLVRRRGFSHVVEMDYWTTWEDGPLEIVFTPAQHWGARFVHDTHRQFGGYIIRNRHTAIYHCGDSAMFDGFGEIGAHCDLDAALLPIGAYGAPSGREVHMNPEEALDAFRLLNAEWMVPMHYGTFPLGNEPIHEPIVRLESAAASAGVRERVLVLPEGKPHVF